MKSRCLVFVCHHTTYNNVYTSVGIKFSSVIVYWIRCIKLANTIVFPYARRRLYTKTSYTYWQYNSFYNYHTCESLLKLISQFLRYLFFDHFVVHKRASTSSSICPSILVRTDWIFVVFVYFFLFLIIIIFFLIFFTNDFNCTFIMIIELHININIVLFLSTQFIGSI